MTDNYNEQNSQAIKFEHPSVQSYTNQLEWVINRLATQSMHCKTVCSVLLTGIITFGIKNNGILFFLGLFLICVFCFFDCKYLSYERKYRKLFDDFLLKMNKGTAGNSDLFNMKASINIDDMLSSLKSWSISYFYLTMAIVLCVLYIVISCS